MWIHKTYLIIFECAPCGLKIALCELNCVVKLFIVAEEEVVEAGGGVAEGGGVECWHENHTTMKAMYVLLSSLKQQFLWKAHSS